METDWKVGARVKVKTTADGSDKAYAGREGIIKLFDPSLPWSGPRALLASEQYVCVHFVPRSDREKERGSPMVLIDPKNLVKII